MIRHALCDVGFKQGEWTDMIQECHLQFAPQTAIKGSSRLNKAYLFLKTPT